MILTGAFDASADNRGQWRGANFDSVSSEAGEGNTLGTEVLSKRWQYELPGAAGASPVAWADRIFVSTAAGDALKLICLETSGRKLWERNLPGENRTAMDNSNSASPSPITDGEYVWVMMGNGAIACFDFCGKEIWSKDLQVEYGTFAIQFGMSTSPVLHNDKLYLTLMHGMKDAKPSSEGMLVCLDAISGKEVWQVTRKTDATFESKDAYTSPMVVGEGDRACLVVRAADYTTGHAVGNGVELWRLAGVNPKGENDNRTLRLVASPVFHQGLMVVPTAKKGAVIGYEFSAPKKPQRAWRLEHGTPDVASPVVYRNRVFLACENGVMKVLDASNGNILTKKRLLADRRGSTPVVFNGRLIIAQRDGTVSAFSADEESELISEDELNEPTVASPAVANGQIYVRTSKALYSFELK